jgi:hypothetical protein
MHTDIICGTTAACHEIIERNEADGHSAAD